MYIGCMLKLMYLILRITLLKRFWVRGMKHSGVSRDCACILGNGIPDRPLGSGYRIGNPVVPDYGRRFI